MTVTQFTENTNTADLDKGPKVTIYTRSEFIGNVVAIRARLLGHGRKAYAQYDQAPYVRYVEKGKRTVRGIVQGYNPYILIVEGWDTPEPDSMMGESKSGNVPGCTIRQSRYASFDPGWVKDFEAVLAKSSVNVIADYRDAQWKS